MNAMLFECFLGKFLLELGTKDQKIFYILDDVSCFYVYFSLWKSYKYQLNFKKIITNIDLN